MLLSCAAYSLFASIFPVHIAEKLDPKSLEAAVALSQTLTQWAFLIMGGSVVILVGTSYHQPAKRLVRGSYFLFIPGWSLLGLSIYRGTLVQRANLGYLLFPNPDAAAFRKTINRDAYGQILTMEWGLAVFGLWLLIYLCWWILRADVQTLPTR